MDDAHSSACEFKNFWNLTEIAVHQNDGRGRRGKVRSQAHGNSQIGLGQGQRIAPAVAHHSDYGTTLLPFAEDLGLLRRKKFGAETLDAELPCDGLGGRTRVTGDEMRLDAPAPQFGNHGNGIAARAIAEREAALQSTIPSEKDDRMSLRLPLASD